MSWGVCGWESYQRSDISDQEERMKITRRHGERRDSQKKRGGTVTPRPIGAGAGNGDSEVETENVRRITKKEKGVTQRSQRAQSSQRRDRSGLTV